MFLIKNFQLNSGSFPRRCVVFHMFRSFWNSALMILCYRDVIGRRLARDILHWLKMYRHFLNAFIKVTVSTLKESLFRFDVFHFKTSNIWTFLSIILVIALFKKFARYSVSILNQPTPTSDSQKNLGKLTGILWWNLLVNPKYYICIKIRVSWNLIAFLLNNAFNDNESLTLISLRILHVQIWNLLPIINIFCRLQKLQTVVCLMYLFPGHPFQGEKKNERHRTTLITLYFSWFINSYRQGFFFVSFVILLKKKITAHETKKQKMIKERWSSVSRKDMASERRKQDLNICLPLLNIFRQLILMTEGKKCYGLI